MDQLAKRLFTSCLLYTSRNGAKVGALRYAQRTDYYNNDGTGNIQYVPLFYDLFERCLLYTSAFTPVWSWNHPEYHRSYWAMNPDGLTFDYLPYDQIAGKVGTQGAKMCIRDRLSSPCACIRIGTS